MITLLTSLYETSKLLWLSLIVRGDENWSTYVLDSVFVTSALMVRELVTSATSGMPTWTLRVDSMPIVAAPREIVNKVIMRV